MKQESHTRVRFVLFPVRSLWSSTLEQKQVGQTMVQFAHERQRAAIASQCGWSIVS
jgi:hypothetical protein